MKIRTRVSLRPYTTFRIGGKAAFFASVRTLDELREAWRFSELHNLARIIIGSGSNLLIADGEVPGFVLHIAYRRFSVRGTGVVMGAGATLDECVARSVAAGLRGMENLSGIPGTVGGAVYGNAGAWGAAIGDVVDRVRVFDGAGLKEYDKAACGFGYRTSAFKQQVGTVLWEIELNLAPGNRAPLQNTRDAIRAYRRVRYPARLRSAGSFFKNVPAGTLSDEVRARLPGYAFSGKEVSAGYLIEQARLLGKCVGGAYICGHQGNFFVNNRNATSSDVVALARAAQEAVRARFNVLLEPEVRCIGFSNYPFIAP